MIWQNFRACKNGLKFFHFHQIDQFCPIFIGKDEVFHGLLFPITGVMIRLLIKDVIILKLSTDGSLDRSLIKRETQERAVIE